MTAAMTAAARVKVTWRKDPSTPEPPKWHIAKEGTEVATVSSDWEAVAWCEKLNESDPAASLELRDANTGETRLWHPEYPWARSLGLWEDLIRQYEPFRDILRFVRETTRMASFLVVSRTKRRMSRKGSY